MILECPNCQTRFMVPDNAIGADGRKVRCAKCKHQWHQMPDHDDVEDEFDSDLIAIAQEDEPAPQAKDFAETLSQTNPNDLNIIIDKRAKPLPALSQPASHQSWMIASLLVVVGMIIFGLLMGRHAFYPIMPAVYQTIGYYPNDGVVLANLKITPLKSLRKKRFMVNCLLVNTADSPQMRPPIAMRILSDGGNVLAEDNDYVAGGGRLMEPGEQIDCGDIEVTHDFASAERLMIEIASPFEMGRRAKWSPAKGTAP